MAVQIQIIKSGTVGDHTEYTISAQESGQQWTVQRRYKEFLALDRQLSAMPAIQRTTLPEKGMFGFRHMLNLNGFNEERQRGLQQYLSHLAMQLQSLSQCPPLAQFVQQNMIAHAAVAQSGVANPIKPEPHVAQPTMAQPVPAQPVAAQAFLPGAGQAMAAPSAPPMAAQPVVAHAQPAVAQPVMAQPIMAQPAMPQPAMAQPAQAQPVMAQPAIAQPVMSMPVSSQPVMAQPVAASGGNQSGFGVGALAGAGGIGAIAGAALGALGAHAMQGGNPQQAPHAGMGRPMGIGMGGGGMGGLGMGALGMGSTGMGGMGLNMGGGAQACFKCEGRGFCHTSTMDHDKSPSERCFFCKDCDGCGGRGHISGGSTGPVFGGIVGAHQRASEGYRDSGHISDGFGGGIRGGFAAGNQACFKCEGRGFCHESSMDHDKAFNQRCFFCKDCNGCGGSGHISGGFGGGALGGVGVGMQACFKCEGRGFSHESSMDHDKAFNERCFFCKDCSGCGGSGHISSGFGGGALGGVGVGMQACFKCEGRGFCHDSSMDHDNGPNERCFFCKDCDGCSGRGYI